MTQTPEVLLQRDFVYTLEDLIEAQKSHGPENGKSPHRSLIGWAVFVGLAVVIYNFLQKNQPAPAAPNPNQGPPPLQDLVTALIPWLMVVAVVVFFVVRGVRGRTKKAWDTNEKLQCPQTLQVTADGITVKNQYGTSAQNWLAFRRFLESANLFILYSSPVAMNVIPKRVLSSPDELDWFRALLNKEITERRTAAGIGGFPVLPPSENQIASDGGKNAD